MRVINVLVRHYDNGLAVEMVGDEERTRGEDPLPPLPPSRRIFPNEEEGYAFIKEELARTAPGHEEVISSKIDELPFEEGLD